MAQQRKTWKLYIGRWCPFHEGHKYIVDSMLAAGHNVAIAVRRSHDLIPANIRAKAIRHLYWPLIRAGRVKVFCIPDVDTVCVGRGVGYALMQAPEEIQKISGTAIREGAQKAVPPEVQAVLDEWIAPYNEEVAS